VINTVENSLDYLGVHTDGVSTSPLADVSVTKSLPPEVSEMMQLSIENGYKRFITLVADSRKKRRSRSMKSLRVTSGPGRMRRTTVWWTAWVTLMTR
jgi:ClpP class serine protease